MPIDIIEWSTHYHPTVIANDQWLGTNLGPAAQTSTILPGHYYLVQEIQGVGGTTDLPAADAIGTTNLSGTNGKVALVASTAPLSGNTCPIGGNLVDLVGYGSATCFETAATPALSNTTAAVRRVNGCVDTDHNANDLVTVGPIPRNSAAPAHFCGGDPGQLAELGIATPSSVLPSSNVLLTVHVTPASAPPSTGTQVIADLSSIGGSTTQPLFDDGTHGDQGIGDSTYSFQATVGAFIATGVTNMGATVSD